MKFLGFEINRRKALQAPHDTGRWHRIHDSFTGAWQQDVDIELDTVLTFSAVFRCVDLISKDISKMRVLLTRLTDAGVWQETQDERYTAVIRKPNTYQTRIKFFQQWMVSKLLHGPTYVLKARDDSGAVRRMWVLDPTRVQPLISDSGEVFYKLNTNRLAGIDEQITVPGSEIIHDVYMAPEHPLVGVSPIGACGLPAMQGLKIQNNSEKFFANMSTPGGMLTAPGTINDATAARLKTEFEERYGGDNIGRLAVAGDGLSFEQFTMSAVDSQLIEQLNMTALNVCTAFGVPPYKIGIGDMPAYNNINALDQAYYSQTLQEPIESIELLLKEGQEMPDNLQWQFDLEGLLRMDFKTQAEVAEIRTRSGIQAPNEGRAKINLGPVKGGNTPYLQQQNFSLAALRDRDVKAQAEDTDVQAAAMNGAQVTSLQGLIESGALGTIPIETIRAAIAAAFPLLDADQINDMIAPLEAEPPDLPEPPDPPDPPPEPEQIEEEFAHFLQKEINHASE